MSKSQLARAQANLVKIEAEHLAAIKPVLTLINEAHETIRVNNKKRNTITSKYYTDIKIAKFEVFKAKNPGKIMPLKGEIKKVYKKCRTENGLCIVVLRIPERAKRFQEDSQGLKCRAERAEVLSIEYLMGNKYPKGTVACSRRNWDFKYQVGKFVKPKRVFSGPKAGACASGIHFFMERRDAVNY